MFKIASRSMMRTGSKESNISDMSATHEDFIIKIGKATKTGTMHANEDRCVVLETLTDLFDEEVISVSEMLEFDLKSSGDFLEKVVYVGVFDGHGGSGCSSYVAKNLHMKIAKLSEQANISTMDEECKKMLSKAFMEVDQDFAQYAKPTNDTSGCCAAAALISGKEIMFSHCGDCRAVLRHNGETIVATKDHRADNDDERRRIIQNGGRVIEGRVCGVLSPSRGFGDSDVRAVCPPNIFITTPDVSKFTVDVHMGKKPKTFCIMASDGLWDVMEPVDACDFVEKVMRRSGSADVAAQKLVEAASKNNHDDVTVVVIAWQAIMPSIKTSKLSMKLSKIDLLSASEPNSPKLGTRDASSAPGIPGDQELDEIGTPKITKHRLPSDLDAKLLRLR